MNTQTNQNSEKTALDLYIEAAQGPITSEELKGYRDILEAYEAIISQKGLSKTKILKTFEISGLEIKHISKGKAKMTSRLAYKLVEALGGDWASWVALGNKKY